MPFVEGTKEMSLDETNNSSAGGGRAQIPQMALPLQQQLPFHGDGLLPAQASSQLQFHSQGVQGNLLQQHMQQNQLSAIAAAGSPAFSVQSSALLPAPAAPATTLEQQLLHARQQATKHVETIIRTQLPSNDTSDFLTALRVAPHLVSEESNPLKFLRSCGFDARRTAERLALYWKSRRSAFGERAFRPINLTGEGALSKKDVDYFGNGDTAFLPNDREGRAVVCFDLSRRLDHTLETRLRLAFYVGHVIAENEESQTNGWVGICTCSDTELDEHTAPYLNTLKAAFPTKIKALHKFNLVVPDGATELPSDLESVFQDVPTCSHTNKNDFLTAMEALGIPRKNLPRALGGGWTSAQFMQWQKERTRIERQRLSMQPPPSVSVSERPTSTTNSGDDYNGGSRDDSGDDDAYYDLGKKFNCVISPDHYRLMDEMLQELPSLDQEFYAAMVSGTSEELRDSEANQEWFLRAEDLNCWLAAKRLIRYWKLRSETFGEKKFSPLDQTGEGGMERKDLGHLGTGFINILPNDHEGCPVIWIDVSRIRQKAPIKCIRRCLFYMFSLLAENDEAQKGGATLLFFLNDQEPPFLNFIQKLADVLPVRFQAVYLLSLYAVPDIFSSYIDFAEEVRVHVASTRAELGAFLVEQGFQRDNLPKRLEGTWGYERFVQWQELRTRLEWKIPAGLSGRADVASEFKFPVIRPYSALSEDEKNERKRRMNVVHSRRKRDRERIEIDVLQEQVSELKEKQRVLQREYQELDGMYRSAMASIPIARFG